MADFFCLTGLFYERVDNKLIQSSFETSGDTRVQSIILPASAYIMNHNPRAETARNMHIVPPASSVLLSPSVMANKDEIDEETLEEVDENASYAEETLESVAEPEEEPWASLEDQINEYEMAIKKAFKAKKLLDEANALNELGIVYYKVGRYPEALNCHERQLRLALLMQDKRIERRALCNLGCSAKNAKFYDRALDCFQKGLEMAAGEGDKKAEGKFLNNMASAYENMADFENAKKYYETRLTLAKSMKDMVGETKCCASLGNVLHVSGNIRESIRYFERVVVCIKLKIAAETRHAMRNQESSSSEKPLEAPSSERSYGSQLTTS